MRPLRMILCAALIAGSAVAVSAAPAAASAAQCQALTAKYQALIAPANSITSVNGPLIIIGQGPFPGILNGLKGITDELYTDIGDNTLCLPSDTSDYNNLATVSAELFKILTGKAGLFSTLPLLGRPVVDAAGSLQVAMAYWLAVANATLPYAPEELLYLLIDAYNGLSL